MLPGSGLLFVSLAALATSQGIADPTLTGTWSSKSNKTLTGPGFYDPVNEKLTEPSHTGISYSFTEDGFYEVAFYRAIANPVDPACPKGIMQWQHGSFVKEQNGSLILSPIKVDGRQLYSDPCKYKSAVYTRYNQSELFQRYTVYTDPYHNIPRLDLFKFDGSPVQPLYLAFKPPQILPTTTLQQTMTASGTAGTQATATSRSKLFRRAEPASITPNTRTKRQDNYYSQSTFLLIGIITTGIGSVLFFFF
ncbi:hypothetical protein EJ05DRAFT_27094 [Pseudovirgaria hyperparasitica]|uniref:Protein ROT1 n=1 Tax=Pseudovirgaria hyperparasitica TaxID=470096 RepID=A0A6A6WLR5_9PEZI|nr:uncharacterized protein EJ05DRAFT_27094 [Pseudovirgaria hyperparasitica]KAF2763131.1 hypothetical protein EJ05DRAFT_27094 [Pseudovirgaria hyperparasitica]